MSRRRRPTSTSAFGVGRRESHDASGFYDRFTAPVLSQHETVDSSPIKDKIVTGRRPPHGRGRGRVGGARGDLAAVLRRQGVRRGTGRRGRPRQLSRLPGDADRGLRRMRAHARARWSHRGERGQPGPETVPVAVGRCDRHPPGPPGPAAAGRGDLAQGAWGQRVVCVGLVPEPGQPGPARPHRAGRHRQQGSLRPRPDPRGAPGTGPAIGGVVDQGGVHRGDDRRVGAPQPSAPPGSGIRRRSPSSSRCA